jgi:hypothetical protein
MHLSIDKSKNSIEVFGVIKTRYKDETAHNKWTITSFKFDRPLDKNFYGKLKADSKVEVRMKYEKGFKVYLQGEKAAGGWTEHCVGTLPGTPKGGIFAG